MACAWILVIATPGLHFACIAIALTSMSATGVTARTLPNYQAAVTGQFPIIRHRDAVHAMSDHLADCARHDVMGRIQFARLVFAEGGNAQQAVLARTVATRAMTTHCKQHTLRQASEWLGTIVTIGEAGPE
jgi:hypothetical protein